MIDVYLFIFIFCYLHLNYALLIYYIIYNLFLNMDSKDVIIMFSEELTQKKIKVESLKDLKSGSLFL